MLTFIATTIGGIAKDITVAASNTFDYIVDEVSSVPSAFSTGFDHGLITGPDLEEPDHHVDVEETIAEKHAGPKFKAKAA
jgi:hypothetical protein